MIVGLTRIRGLAILGFGTLVGPLHAGTFSSSTTAPVVNTTDIANFAAQTGTDKWFFQSANEANPSDAAKGQTFTTGSAPILLKALSYKLRPAI